MERVDQQSPELTLIKESIEISNSVLQPVRLRPQEISILRTSFQEAGLNFVIESTERDALVENTKLRVRVELDESDQVVGTQTYNYSSNTWQQRDQVENQSDEDRIAGLIAVLGGEKFDELLKWSHKAVTDAGFRRSIGGNKGTRNRGTVQVVADLISLCVLDPNQEREQIDRMLRRINARLYRGALASVDKENAEVKEIIKTNFSEEFDKLPTSKTAGIPPSILPQLIVFLASEAN